MRLKINVVTFPGLSLYTILKSVICLNKHNYNGLGFKDRFKIDGDCFKTFVNRDFKITHC